MMIEYPRILSDVKIYNCFEIVVSNIDVRSS